MEFHHIILEAPDNKILLERNEFMYALVEFQLHNEKFSVERARLGLKQHIYILEAILRAITRTHCVTLWSICRLLRRH